MGREWGKDGGRRTFLDVYGMERKRRTRQKKQEGTLRLNTRGTEGFFLFFFLGARMWSKNRDFGWKRQKRRFGPDGCRRGEEGGLSIHLCPGVQKDVGPISGHAYFPSFPPKCSKLRVRLAEAFTRRKGRKTLGEFSPSPPPPYFFRPICHPTHLGGIERKSMWREDRVNNLSEKLKKNCL